MRLLHHKKIARHFFFNIWPRKYRWKSNKWKSNFSCFCKDFLVSVVETERKPFSAAPQVESGVSLSPWGGSLSSPDDTCAVRAASDMERSVGFPDRFAQRTQHFLPRLQKLPRMPHEMGCHQRRSRYKQPYLAVSPLTISNEQMLFFLQTGFQNIFLFFFFFKLLSAS